MFIVLRFVSDVEKKNPAIRGMNIDFGDFTEGRRKPCTSIVSPQVIKKHPA